MVKPPAMLLRLARCGSRLAVALPTAHSQLAAPRLARRRRESTASHAALSTCSASSSASWTPRRNSGHWRSRGPTPAPATGRLMLAVLGGLADVERDLITRGDIFDGLYVFRRASSSSRAKSSVPLTNSSRDGMKGTISGSVLIIGAKSEVVVRHPFDAPSPCRTPISALTSFAVTRCGGVYALTWPITRIKQIPLFDGNNIASIIATTGRKCHFEPCLPG
jgi:hypothetical protein